jgi:guanosine-3',5'-bis(diphosphate) 3'-pyrophosphohydrolase
MSIRATPLSLLQALVFASRKHRLQRRKDQRASPYINHAIDVAAILADCGVADTVTLQAAILHDTIEDTETTGEELQELFGPLVRRIVEEVTDDKALPSRERKHLQVLEAPDLSPQAKLVKIADKIANARDMGESPPTGWSQDRREEYLLWTEEVVEGCRGVSPVLESRYDVVLDEALERVRLRRRRRRR